VGRPNFTHCGSEIVRRDTRAIAAPIRSLGSIKVSMRAWLTTVLMLLLPG
jgi:hypothetical protein